MRFLYPLYLSLSLSSFPFPPFFGLYLLFNYFLYGLRCARVLRVFNGDTRAIVCAKETVRFIGRIKSLIVAYTLIKNRLLV